jgi:hypothetical protein
VKDNISDPITTILATDNNQQSRPSRDLSGRAGNIPVKDEQGFGIIGHHPPPLIP